MTENLTNPALLFFFLESLQSGLKGIWKYQLFAIGFKEGQELSHGDLNMEIFWTLLFGIALAIAVPLYVLLIMKKRIGVSNAAAVAAAYGSVSAVTFVTAVAFLEAHSKVRCNEQ